MTECRKEKPNISSKSMNDLEEDAVTALSTIFKQKSKETKKPITRKPKTLEAFKRKQKRWGRVVLRNTQESKGSKLSSSFKNSFEINDFEEYPALNPRKLVLPNDYNLFAWMLSHFVYRSEFQGEDTPDILKNHTTPTNMTAQNYWIYRNHTMCSKTVTFSDDDEIKLLSAYAVYNKADEEYLNTAFPKIAPFPECKESCEIYSTDRFLKIIVYPIYSFLIKSSLIISAARLLLKSHKDVCFTSNSFPTMKEIREKYVCFLPSSAIAQRNYFIANHISISKAIKYFCDIDALFLLLFAAIVLEVNKEWI